MPITLLAAAGSIMRACGLAGTGAAGTSHGGGIGQLSGLDGSGLTLRRQTQLPRLLQACGFSLGGGLLGGTALLCGSGQFGFTGLGDGAIQAGGQCRCLWHQAAGTAQSLGGVIQIPALQGFLALLQVRFGELALRYCSRRVSPAARCCKLPSWLSALLRSPLARL